MNIFIIQLQNKKIIYFCRDPAGEVAGTSKERACHRTTSEKSEIWPKPGFRLYFATQCRLTYIVRHYKYSGLAVKTIASPNRKRPCYCQHVNCAPIDDLISTR